MKYITDDRASTREFTHEDGDVLYLLRYPRQKDIERIAVVAREKALEDMKALGVDVEKVLADASAEELEKARESNESEKDDPLADPYEVRYQRFVSVAFGIQPKGDEFLNREAALKRYEDLDPGSARWVDTCVAEVFASAVPSDADTQGQGALSAVVAD